jgi:hypothetical protein
MEDEKDVGERKGRSYFNFKKKKVMIVGKRLERKKGKIRDWIRMQNGYTH